MNLESPKVTVPKSAQELFDLLSDVKNFEKLMPENIAKFEVIGDDAFIFGLKGDAGNKTKNERKVAPSKIVLGAASDMLPFTLIANIDTVSENSSDVKLDFEGDFNPMMAMMNQRLPISKFIEIIIFQISDSLLLIVIFIQAISFIQQRLCLNGELKITKLNTQQRIISGTFWFDAILSGEKIEIREGRFDMRYVN